jgi:hypothetical protein
MRAAYTYMCAMISGYDPVAIAFTIHVLPKLLLLLLL